MENRAVALEGEIAIYAMAQGDDMDAQARIFFKFLEQNHFPGSGMATRQSA
jgi:hypothetical protein